ncbi:MAG: electron transfer flavoprotein subunit alpha/FixB family protein [Christensenellales bacterium]|jgi:electron transfer flavoprotein alpha subunit
MKTIVYFEKAHPHACELIAKAREFSCAIIALCEDEACCPAAFGAGADETVIINSIQDDCAQGDIAADAIRTLDADSVLFPATIRGRFLSGWVAAKLETGLTADCTALSVTDSGLLLQRRPAFGGNLTADILCKTARPQMASVRPGVFPMPLFHKNATGPIRYFEKSAPISYLKKTGFIPTEKKISLQDAKVVVAGGKGVGSKQGFGKLARLASLLGGTVGATRSAVDAGYATYEYQIGQTGQTTRAELYIGFGLSGAIQHTVGMDSSKIVIAVNKDRSAPIFSHADYGVVGDWEDNCDRMIVALENRV